jgi:hypothetical protein
MFSGHGLALGVGPGHELVDLAGGMAVDETGEGGGQVGLGIDGVELRRLDQRGDDAPVRAALVRAFFSTAPPHARSVRVRNRIPKGKIAG